MKFGFYSPYLDSFGGGERYMLTLASYLSKNHLVDIFCDDAILKAPLARFLKIDLSKTRFTRNIFKLGLLQRSFNSLGYNLIFVLSDGSIPLSFAAKNLLHFQVPFNFSKIDFKTRLKLKRYTWVIANSYFTKSYIDKSFGVSSKVIYPPVDVDDIKPGKKENLILSVGRFSPRQLHPKKQEVLIEVFKEVYKKAPSYKLILVGQAKKEDYKYLRNLRKTARGHAIKIIENLPVEKLRDLYSRSKIYWHATGFSEDEIKSPQMMEHFGIATVEASAAGAVPIVIGKGGQKEIIQDGKNGKLWITKAQLYESTLSVINSTEQFTMLSQNAIKNSRRFAKRVFLAEYEKLIF